MKMEKKSFKQVKLGTVISEKRPDGSNNTYIALGSQKNKDPKYDFNVSIMVTDKDGNVLAKQTNGFVNVTDPRKLPDILLATGKINEEQADRMRERVSRMPAKISKELFIKA
jgi:hypothetical protein